MDEDFAVESLRGDIILLGNTSWRIRRVQSGSVSVEDAKGAPPNVPFWRGEAPSRTTELSQQVAHVRETGADAVITANPGCIIQIAATMAQCGVLAAAYRQLIGVRA